MEKVSIILPVYNVQDYIKECLDSILKQTYQNLEIILIDDGSKDSSGEICDEYQKRDNRIIVLHKENNGVSAARNSGLELGNLLDRCYRHEIRNAFAHSQYSIDASRRLICIRTDEGILTLKFDEFQEIFLKSVILMNQMENLLEMNHDAAAQMQIPLTDVFKTPDGLPVQVYGEMVKRGKILCPEFRLVRVKEDD